MQLETDLSRRTFVTVAGAASASALAGCSDIGGETTASTPAATETDSQETTRADGTETPNDGTSDLVAAIEQAAVPVELTDSSANLDAVAAQLAETPIVGLGETSHGVREFKTVPHQLVRRLVGDHGYRLLAIEGTLGDFAPVNDYVTRGEGDLDAAMSSLEFYFWRTDEIRRLFEWLREFNEGRPGSERVEVRGYDAQFHDVNATTLQSYIERVDPAYLDEIDDRLDPLTTPLYRRSDASFMTDTQVSLIEELRTRLQTHEGEYVDSSSRSEWQLARRHVWTLEQGLRFLEQSTAQNFTKGKRIRDSAMAENVAWLREWTGSDRVVVMGNANHTMRSHDTDQQAARMGEHLHERFGDDYYSLGMLFGTGSFAAPGNHQATEFETYDLGGPVDGTLAATLATVGHPQLFLDFDEARDQSVVDSWLADTSKLQFSVPRVAERGAVPLPAPPGEVLDGAVFVREVSPASFSAGE